MTNYPLAWPAGWRRTKPEHRTRAKFNKKTKSFSSVGNGASYRSSEVTIAEGSRRVLKELMAFGVEEGDAIISTNLTLRLDGLPRSDQAAPADPGVAVYWKRKDHQQHQSMAIDRYDRIADNLAAIAATLEAMRAIERHGGAMILERAFMGFTALPAPNTWRDVLRAHGMTSLDEVRETFKKLAMVHHPDRGGTEAKMKELNWAMYEAMRELMP